MSEKRSIFSRVFTLISTIAGLLSGAAVMYLSPLVDRVVKPGRPLANFAVETEGLNATFHNRYAGEGWWDFGDGSPLEPAIPDAPSVTHVYPKSGVYPAKLFVRNFLGDEHERSVSVEVTVNSQPNGAPTITSLEAHPVSADRTAPTTYRLVAQTANADRLVWDIGTDRGPEVSMDSPAKQERFITFATPGQHNIILTATNGTQATRKAVAVQVDAPRGDTLVARLKITDRGTRMDRRESTEMLPVTLARNSTSTIPIDRRMSMRLGFTVVEAKLGPVDPAFANLKVTVTPDKRSIQVTGSLSPTKAMLQSQTPPTIPIVLIQERQLRLMAPAAEVTAAVSLPGSTALPLPTPPTDQSQTQRAMILELRGANGLVWQQPLPAKNSLIEFQGKRYTVTATPSDREVRVELLPSTTSLTGRER